MKKVIAISMILTALTASAFADEAHHPDETQAQADTQAVPTQPGPGTMGPGMMGGQGMMSGQGMMGPGMMGQGMMMGGGMMSGCPMMGGMSGNQHTEGRLAFLKTELKIKSGQERAWNAYADAVRGIAKDMGGMTMGPGMMTGQGGMMMGQSQSQRMAAPDAMKSRIAMMESHLKSAKTLQSATAKLYAALSDEQKTIADELLGGMGMM